MILTVVHQNKNLHTTLLFFAVNNVCHFRLQSRPIVVRLFPNVLPFRDSFLSKSNLDCIIWMTLCCATQKNRLRISLQRF
jgi:hypothetical protein